MFVGRSIVSEVLFATVGIGEIVLRAITKCCVLFLLYRFALIRGGLQGIGGTH